MNESAVVFDPADFRLFAPQFAELSDDVLQGCFKAAELLLDNTDESPAKDLNERKSLLYLLVCHIATRKADGGDVLAGMITNATQGKVSVSVTPFANANWYNSTQYGAMFWEATAKYRTGVRYTPYRQGGGGLWRR